MNSPSDDKIKDFINFLDKHKCLKAYEYNRKKYKKAYFEGKRKLNPGFAFIHPRYYASYAFEYWETPEGFRFLEQYTTQMGRLLQRKLWLFLIIKF